MPKIVSVIPQSSLVGQLLTSNTDHRIVTSKAVAVGQHLAYAWEVMRNDFVYADELSRLGVIINRTMTNWLAELDDGSREMLTNAIFEVISASESESFYEINQHKMMADIFPVVFILIAMLILLTTMTRIIAHQRTQIGILKANGFTNKSIIFHYM